MASETMDAGRELDAIVAERVMGSVPCRSDLHRNGEMLPCHAHPDWPTKGAETPLYSTDVAAAWQVVEHMREWEFVLSREEHEPGTVTYRAIVYQRSRKFADSWRGRENETADSPSLAICRAALMARLSVPEGDAP